MLTLQVFFEGCASIRSAARALDVHDNTIRYRLARIEDLTGYSFGDADDVLRIHLALKILDLKKLAEDDPVEGPGPGEAALSAAT